MHKKQDYLLMLRDLNSFKEKWSLYTEKEFDKVFWKTGISQFLRFSKWHSVVIPKTWKRIKVLSKRVFAFENKRYSQIELETRTRVRIPVSVWNIYIYIYYLHCRGQFLRGIGSNSFTNFRRQIIGREAKFFDVREVGNIHKYYCLQIDISIKFHLSETISNNPFPFENACVSAFHIVADGVTNIWVRNSLDGLLCLFCVQYAFNMVYNSKVEPAFRFI